MYDYPGLFWASLALLVAVAVWVVVKAIRNPYQLLGWPLVLSMMWLYFFGYMAYQAVTHLRASIPRASIIGMGEFVSLLCFIGVLAGWRQSIRSAPRVLERESPSYRVTTIWWIGIFWTVIGVIGTYSVRATWAAMAARGEQPDISHLSGYQVFLYHVGYPGMAMCLWAALKSRGARKVFYFSGLILTAAIFIFPYLGSARRGPMFPLLAVFVFLPSLVTKRRPNPAVIIGGLALSGVLMLALVAMRGSALTGKWNQAVAVLTPEDVLVSRTLSVKENEFINSVYTIAAVYENGKYQYGTGHMSLVFHWIPRSVWPDKPALGEGWYSWKELYADVNAKAGQPLVGFGAAIGGIADSFVQYGFLAPLYWFALAFFVGRVFARALPTDDPRWHLSYLGLVCASHWLVSQSLSEAIVPAAAYQAVPFLTFALCRQRSARPVSSGLRQRAEDAPLELRLN